MCAEGSGSAGTLACTPTPHSRSVRDGVGAWAHTAVVMLSAAVEAEATAMAAEMGRGSAWGRRPDPQWWAGLSVPVSSAQISSLQTDMGTGTAGTRAANHQ